MDHIYHYMLSANNPDAPMPVSLNGNCEFVIEGGEESASSIELPEFIATLPKDGHTYDYTYSAVNIDDKKERYVLEKDPKTVTVSIDTNKSVSESVSIQYLPSNTWTHVLNPLIPVPLPDSNQEFTSTMNDLEHFALNSTMDTNSLFTIFVLMVGAIASFGYTLQHHKKKNKYMLRHAR